MTRAQLAKVLAVARQWGLITPAEPRFSDVSPDNWMYSYVETVAARGAMLGYSDGTFMPAGTISRASTVRAVVLAAGWTPLYGGQPEPAGGNPASWAAPFLQAAWAHGVSWSDDEIDLNLTARANRGEVSVLVYKMMKALDRENAPAGPDDTTP